MISPVQFRRSVMFDSLQPPWTAAGQAYVHHRLPEIAETHVHQVGDAIQASHPLSSPSPPTFNLSQHQGLSQWVGSSHQVTKVLEFQLQHQSFQWISGLISFRVDWFDLLWGEPNSISILAFSSIQWGKRTNTQTSWAGGQAVGTCPKVLPLPGWVTLARFHYQP